MCIAFRFGFSLLPGLQKLIPKGMRSTVSLVVEDTCTRLGSNKFYNHGQLPSLGCLSDATSQFFLCEAHLEQTEQEALGRYWGKHRHLGQAHGKPRRETIYPKGVSFTSSFTDIQNLTLIVAISSLNYGKSHFQIKLCSSFRS